MSQRTRWASKAGTTAASGVAAARSFSTTASAAAASLERAERSTTGTSESCTAAATGAAVGAGGRPAAQAVAPTRTVQRNSDRFMSTCGEGCWQWTRESVGNQAQNGPPEEQSQTIAAQWVVARKSSGARSCTGKLRRGLQNALFCAPMNLTVQRHDPYASLRIPNFRWFIVSLLTMNVATQLQAVVVAWQIYALTHDPLSLGLIGLAEAIPFIGFALPAGHVADRSRRLAIARIALAALLTCSVTLLVFTVRPGLVNPARVWPIYLVIFLSGIARSFLQPARTALSAEVVPRPLYPNAVTWRSSTWQLAAVLGPALGGLIYGFGTATAAYAVDVGLMLVALLSIARIDHVPKAPPPSDDSVLQSLASGVRFVRRQPVVLGA